MKYIYLSPSKQESNYGYGNYGSEEQRMNQLVDAMIPYLDASGVGHYRNNPTMSTIQIVADSDNKKANFHLAIHSNAGNKTARGCEVLIYQNGGERERMAQIIYDKLSAITPTADRGIKVNPALTELKLTDAPACLVEIAFHDNAEDATFIMENIKKIARTLSECICEYFDVTFVDPYYVAPAPVVSAPIPESGSFLVRVTATDLKIRSGAGTNFTSLGYVKPGAYTIIEVKQGIKNSTMADWGFLKSGAGWICLDYVTRI